MRLIPFISLAVAAVFVFLAWKRREQFEARPYFYWFIYLHLAATGTILYMPLSLLTARHAVKNDDIDGRELVSAFALGTIASFLPFIHVWIAFALRNSRP